MQNNNIAEIVPLLWQNRRNVELSDKEVQSALQNGPFLDLLHST